MLQLRSVTKRYGTLVALDDVSLDIARGEFFGLLGPNGAGKSTLMSLVAGLRAPDAGALTLDGAPLTTRDSATRAALGLVPQSIALYDELSAEQNLKIFGELYGLRGADLRARIDEALEAVKLADRRRDQVKTFSGGPLSARRLEVNGAPPTISCADRGNYECRRQHHNPLANQYFRGIIAAKQPLAKPSLCAIVCATFDQRFEL